MNVGSAPSLRIRRWPHARPLAAFLLALSAILGVPAGQALAIFHIGLTKAKQPKIEGFEQKLQAERPWI